MPRRKTGTELIARAHLAFPLLPATPLLAQAPAAFAPGKLLFQTDHAWSPRTNINADTVMVYGLDDTVARIQSWRAHGYHATVLTDVAWADTARTCAGTSMAHTGALLVTKAEVLVGRYFEDWLLR